MFSVASKVFLLCISPPICLLKRPICYAFQSFVLLSITDCLSL
ncbi:hypothetical protein OIU79_011508 [Salix purpurea]|uniref:Uncharacterized protein n=1 Tax=Salix purpurea TaxID=77065 RepID=A0A9Q0Q1I0_SALPP|nr:hypothetical protein OIU79_011508 [Salix purpurea]